MPHLASNIFLNCQIEPELGAGIDLGVAFTPFPFSILDEKELNLRKHLAACLGA